MEKTEEFSNKISLYWFDKLDLKCYNLRRFYKGDKRMVCFSNTALFYSYYYLFTKE